MLGDIGNVPKIYIIKKNYNYNCFLNSVCIYVGLSYTNKT